MAEILSFAAARARAPVLLKNGIKYRNLPVGRFSGRVKPGEKMVAGDVVFQMALPKAPVSLLFLAEEVFRQQPEEKRLWLCRNKKTGYFLQKPLAEGERLSRGDVLVATLISNGKADARFLYTEGCLADGLYLIVGNLDKEDPKAEPGVTIRASMDGAYSSLSLGDIFYNDCGEPKEA